MCSGAHQCNAGYSCMDSKCTSVECSSCDTGPVVGIGDPDCLEYWELPQRETGPIVAWKSEKENIILIKMRLLLWIQLWMVAHAQTSWRVCKQSCLTWVESESIGPAIAEPVCYRNMTCFHKRERPCLATFLLQVVWGAYYTFFFFLNTPRTFFSV